MLSVPFRVLYRKFLFRTLDRDVLSASAQGDASRLLGRLAAVLVLFSFPFATRVVGVGDSRLPQPRKLLSALPTEHALIATTMLIVGLFVVLSWDAAYPDRRDALVLGPLPVPGRIIFLSKLAALGSSACAAVVIFNGLPGLLWPVAAAPREATPLDWIFSIQFYRSFAAYWLTMIAAGAFVLGLALAFQGVIVQLPRRIYLGVSGLAQLAAFCLLVLDYFLEPGIPASGNVTADDSYRVRIWLPSYWFLGILQQLQGSLAHQGQAIHNDLALRAWLALGIVSLIALLTFLLSYFRTLRRIIEQPDIVPSGKSWMSNFGNSVEATTAQFAIRSLVRSKQHRVLLAFYAGASFAIAFLLQKTPVVSQLAARAMGKPGYGPALALLASSFIMLFGWMAGIRIVFAVPVELRANWIFRTTQVLPARDYLTGTRWAAYVLAIAPVWCFAAIVLPFRLPLLQTLGHLLIFLLIGIALIEWWLAAFIRIPFTCSYLPGKSNLHITFLLCFLLGLEVVLWGAAKELQALFEPRKFVSIALGLLGIAVIAWFHRRQVARDAPRLQFQDEIAPIITSLGL